MGMYNRYKVDCTYKLIEAEQRSMVICVFNVCVCACACARVCVCARARMCTHIISLAIWIIHRMRECPYNRIRHLSDWVLGVCLWCVYICVHMCVCVRVCVCVCVCVRI